MAEDGKRFILGHIPLPSSRFQYWATSDKESVMRRKMTRRGGEPLKPVMRGWHYVDNPVCGLLSNRHSAYLFKPLLSVLDWLSFVLGCNCTAAWLYRSQAIWPEKKKSPPEKTGTSCYCALWQHTNLLLVHPTLRKDAFAWADMPNGGYMKFISRMDVHEGRAPCRRHCTTNLCPKRVSSREKQQCCQILSFSPEMTSFH